jgi:diguanylate cyclase (GGDEF)-like protein
MPAEKDPDWGSFLQAATLAVLEAADEGLLVFDGEGCCRMIGRRAGEIFGVEPASLVGRPREEVLGILSQRCEEPDVFLRAAASDTPLGASRGVTDVDVLRPRPRTVVCKGVSISPTGARPGRLIIVSDVTRERAGERSSAQLRARLSELTPYDPLTGLLNARRFREELEREHGRSSRAWDSYAVLRLDVDGMRAINEEFGMPVGDHVLEQVAARLKSCLREYDILARLEDDEFAVLLPGADSVAARAVAERMLQAIGGKLELERARGVTLSAGGALWIPPSGQVASDILERAGVVLEEARARGANELALDATLVAAK